jgi:protein disulfide-isomerase
MRFITYSLLSLATVLSTFAADTPDSEAKPTGTDDWEEQKPDTIFNGQTVPPIKELGPSDLKQSISKGNW